MDENATIKDQWFGRTVIKSDRRFTYEEAQEIIEGAEGDMKDNILKMHEMAQKLRTARFNNGSIAFERVEVKFEIDDDGAPLGVYFKESKEANQLIEEFMLLANKRVAEFIGKAGKRKAKTFVYRVHDEPDSEKLESFAGIIRKFGYNLRLKANKNLSKDINNLLDKVQGKGEQHLVETLAVRSMAKAKYSVNNIGHYGLAFPHYTHFTSPIRRYPDVMVHRLLDSYLDGGKSADAAKYEDHCRHCSEMEIKAANAERASIKYKQVEFLKDKIGEEFDGIISGVTDWGIYVELVENKCEGMVSIRDLDDDFYEFDEKDFSLVGRKYNRKYQLGDKVRIRIYRANLEKKQLDFLLVD